MRSCRRDRLLAHAPQTRGRLIGRCSLAAGAVWYRLNRWTLPGREQKDAGCDGPKNPGYIPLHSITRPHMYTSHGPVFRFMGIACPADRFLPARYL